MIVVCLDGNNGCLICGGDVWCDGVNVDFDGVGF